MSNENVIIDMIRAAKNSEPHVKTLVDYATLNRDFDSLESADKWFCKIIVEDHTELTVEQITELYNRYSLHVPCDGLKIDRDYVLESHENSVVIYVADY